jgi:hypothetical protein
MKMCEMEKSRLGRRSRWSRNGREENNGDAPSQKRNSTRTTGTRARQDKKEKEEVNQRD